MQLHLSGHPCYWRNLFFFVLFEMMGMGNPCAVEWDSKWGHISVALQLILVVGWLNGCAQFLWVVQTVLHRDHSNGFTWIVLCQSFHCQKKKPCRSAVGRSLIGNSNSLVFWVVCVHSSVEFLGCCVVKAGEEKECQFFLQEDTKASPGCTLGAWQPCNGECLKRSPV